MFRKADFSDTAIEPTGPRKDVEGLRVSGGRAPLSLGTEAGLPAEVEGDLLGLRTSTRDPNLGRG